MSNFMGMNYPPGIEYPDFEVFVELLMKSQFKPGMRIEQSDILRIIMRATLLILYNSVPKPDIFEAFGLEVPDDNKS